MSPELRLKFAKNVCRMLPPTMAQKVRNYIFPLSAGRALKRDFTTRSVTGSVFSGNTYDYHSYRFAVHGFFEWRNVVIANFLSKNQHGDIIEIGANVGTETISFCDILKDRGVVHAFEPLPSNIADLERMARSHKNLHLYQNAVSDSEATLKFLQPPKNSSGTGKIILEDSTENETFDVDAAPLDKFMHGFKNVLLLAIDTEGHEPYVLRGAINTFRQHRPAVIIEVSPKLLKKYANSNISDIYDFFISIDYNCYNINKFGLEIVGIEELNARSSNNWFCIPAESHGIIKPLSAELFRRAVMPWYLLPKMR